MIGPVHFWRYATISRLSHPFAEADAGGAQIKRCGKYNMASLINLTLLIDLKRNAYRKIRRMNLAL
jgi:hypothetical protein